jgi:DNA-binding transcriptional ArsR family regulator
MKEGFSRIAAALGDGTRRQILVDLLDHNPVTPSETMAKSGAQESDDIEVQLFHVHLPKLDSMGYIESEKEHGTIVKGPNWKEIEPVVRLLSENRNQLPADTF